MENRPVLTIIPDAFNRSLEYLTYAIIAGLWITTVISYLGLPDTIPVHFNFEGKVDGYGHKSTILFLPAIVTLVTGLMVYVNRSPHKMNLPVEVTERNAPRVYAVAQEMLRVINLAVVFTFAYLVYDVNVAAANPEAHSSPIGILVVIGLEFIPIVVYLIKLSKAANE